MRSCGGGMENFVDPLHICLIFCGPPTNFCFADPPPRIFLLFDTPHIYFWGTASPHPHKGTKVHLNMYYIYKKEQFTYVAIYPFRVSHVHADYISSYKDRLTRWYRLSACPSICLSVDLSVCL